MNSSIISLDYQSRTPIYEQIASTYERYIALGVVKPKEQMPSIRELAAMLGINPNTVKKAYEKLENKNIIEIVSTKGAFVSEKSSKAINSRINEDLNEIKELVSELKQFGLSKEDIFKRIK